MTEVLDSIDDMQSVFADVQSRAQNADYTQELDSCLSQIVKYEAGMFAGEFDSELVGWAPLRPSTTKRKGLDRILVDTGALRQSLVHIGGHGNIAAATERGLVFDTEIEYAGFLQDGTSRMPAGPPVGMSEETLDKLVNGIADATVEKMKLT